MRYINADHVLPKELIQEIQKYVAGGYMYIPTGDETKKAWGEKTGSRQQLSIRNQKIKEDYRNGSNISELAEAYYLSVSSIKKIIYNKEAA